MPFRLFAYFLVLILLFFIPATNPAGGGGLTITVQAADIQNQLTVKSPTRVTIADREVNLNDPGASLQINLPGVEGQPQVFNIPITVEYQDGTLRYFGFVFYYQPRIEPTPTPQDLCGDYASACWVGAECKEENQESANSVCSQNYGSGSVCTRSTGQPNAFEDGCTKPEYLQEIMCEFEEDAPSCAYGGLQTCTGTWQGGVCKYDDRVNPNCRDIRCNEPPAGTPEPSAPSPGCGDYEFKYPDCDWDNQQVVEVWQDSCGNYELRNAHTEPGQCNAPSESEPPPPEPSCSDDSYYCDENVGWLIHKHGGYWDGSECQYAFDWVEPC